MSGGRHVNGVPAVLNMRAMYTAQQSDGGPDLHILLAVRQREPEAFGAGAGIGVQPLDACRQCLQMTIAVSGHGCGY